VVCSPLDGWLGAVTARCVRHLESTTRVAGSGHPILQGLGNRRGELCRADVCLPVQATFLALAAQGACGAVPPAARAAAEGVRTIARLVTCRTAHLPAQPPDKGDSGARVYSRAQELARPLSLSGHGSLHEFACCRSARVEFPVYLVTLLSALWRQPWQVEIMSRALPP